MRTETKLGIFFLMVLVILGYLIIKLGSFSIFFEKPGYRIKAYFQSIAGLEKKAPVRIAGVKVGYVEDIRLVEGRAEVIMKIYKEFQINRGSKAAVTSMGMMGEKYIEIFPGPPSMGVLEDGEEIEGVPPLSIDQLGTIFYSIAQDVKSLSASLKDVLGTEVGKANLKETLESVNKIMAQINDFIRENRQLVSSSLTRTNRFLEHLEKLVSQLETNSHLLNRLLEKVERSSLPKADEFLVEAEQTSSELKRTLEETRQFLKKLKDGEGTIGKLLEEKEPYEELTGVLKDTKRITEKIKEILPERLVLYPVFEGYYDDGLRASLGLNLERKDYFMKAGIVERNKRLTYNLLVGKRLGYLSIGAGLIEGNFGFDLKAYLSKRLFLRGEIFDFEKNTFFYRFSLGVNVYNGFNLVGGVGKDGTFFAGLCYVK